MKLKGKVMMVTGAGRGIGEAIVKAVAAEGATVALNDVNTENCNKVLGDIKKESPESICVPGDVSVSRSVENMVGSVLKRFGKIDILVNNAGAASINRLEETSEEVWDRIMGIDLKGVFLCSVAVVKSMMENKNGNIINIASNSAQAPIALGGAYSVAKAGVRMLTRLMALEWGKFNIRANSVSPGFIRTPLTESAYKDEEKARKRAEIVPIKRIGTPEDVAKLVLFLASDDSSYVNGEDIVIDGGFLHTTYEQAPNKPKTD